MSAFGGTIQVALSLPDGGEHSAELLEVEGREVELGVAPDGPRLSLTSRVSLRFSGEGLSRSLEVAARVLARVEAGHRRTYRLLLEGRIEEELKRCLRRREAYRVAPDPSRKLRLRLSSAERSGQEPVQSEEVELVDISLLGLSVRVTPDLERRLAEVERVRLDLQLPGEEPPIQVGGRIIRRFLRAGAAMLGIELEELPAKGTSQVEQQLTQFVVRRQIEQLGGG